MDIIYLNNIIIISLFHIDSYNIFFLFLIVSVYKKLFIIVF